MAGKITLTTAQINDSATATNNFVLKADNAGGVKLSRGNDGATTQDILSVDSSGNVNANVAMQQGGIAMPRMVLATAQNATSGTAVDFTGIPSWVNKITLGYNVLSTNGSSPVIFRVGTSSGVAVSGYASNGNSCSNAGSFIVTTGTGGELYIEANSGISAASLRYGQAVLVRLSGNLWSWSGTQVQGGVWSSGAGTVSLPGALDRFRITTLNGTDTFDGGSVNILYEG